MDTITKQEIAKKIFLETGIPTSITSKIVEQTFNYLTDSILKNEKIVISNFGSFKVRNKNSRIGRNLNNEKQVTIPPRKIVSFTPAENLKKVINDET